MKPKKAPMSLNVGKRNSKPVNDDAVEKFGNQAETETQKKPDKIIAAFNKRRNQQKKKLTAGADKVKRDSFTMPEDDYALIGKLIGKLMKSGVLMNKGEILRAGLKALNSMPIKDLKDICDQVEKIKTGRPKE